MPATLYRRPRDHDRPTATGGVRRVRGSVRRRAERGVRLGQQHRPVAGPPRTRREERDRGGGGLRAREQPGVQDENLGRRDVRGRAPVQEGRAGHAVQELPRARRRRHRAEAVPDGRHAERGQLFRRAERQGHRDRPPGSAVDAGLGRGVRPAADRGHAGLHVRPETVGVEHQQRRCVAVRGGAGLHVHGRPVRAQRALGGPEDADGRRGRRGRR